MEQAGGGATVNASRQAATANTMDNFRFVFEKALTGLFIDAWSRTRTSSPPINERG